MKFIKELKFEENVIKVYEKEGQNIFYLNDEIEEHIHNNYYFQSTDEYIIDSMKEFIFNREYVYKREKILMNMIEKWSIDNSYFTERLRIKFNLNIKNNIHLQKFKEQIINDFKSIDFVDSITEDKRFIYINHSNDFKEEILFRNKNRVVDVYYKKYNQ